MSVSERMSEIDYKWPRKILKAGCKNKHESQGQKPHLCLSWDPVTENKRTVRDGAQ